MGGLCRGIKLCIKFFRINRYRKKYEKAKRLGASTSPITLEKKKLSSTRKKKFMLDVLTCFIWRKKSYEETVKSVKSILTHQETYRLAFFIYGLIFAWILFAISYYVGSDDRSFLAIKSVALVAAVSFSMAYSRKLRCITSLLTPTVLTSKGRYLIFVVIANLIIYGPITNMRFNLSENGRIVKCVSEVIIDQATQLITKNPIVLFLKDMLDRANALFEASNEQLKVVLNVLASLYRSLVFIFQHVVEFAKKVGDNAIRIIASIRGWCSTKIINTQRKCIADFSPIMGHILCSGYYFMRLLCWVGEAIFYVPSLNIDWMKKFLVIMYEIAEKRLKEAWNNFASGLEDYFVLNMTMAHEKKIHEYEKTNYSEALENLHGKIDDQMGLFVKFCKILSYFSYLLFLYCVIRAWLYLQRFLLWDSFDNVYITKQIHKIDWERSLAGKPTILPLGYIFRRKYITPFSIRMTSDELRKLQTNIVIYFIHLACIGIFLALEHIIYAPLDMTRKYMNDFDSEIPLPTIKVFTKPESGVLADIIKWMGDYSASIENVTSFSESIAKCKPDPIAPDYDLYQNIGFLTLIVFIAILCESYALRFRFMIAGSMYPSRKFARATWLYNRILSSAPLAKLDAKGKMRAKVLGTSATGSPSQIKRIMYLNPCTTKIYNLFAGKQRYCIVCGESGPLSDTVNFINCINMACKASYCKPCYSEFDKACPLCESVKLDPKVAIIDEEKGSSEDDEIFKFIYDDDWNFRGQDTESEPEMDLKKLELRPPKDFSKYLKPRNIEDGPVDSDASTASDKNYPNVKHRRRNLK
ncbi:DC-STAMP domain-containing protein 2-like [Tetranychus urticae]|uniref:RING-type domain-containing protein n=1 Tax=Tetranychus urticae TaxID=32264 RepID=T1KVI9_TETUR|nr:DC-STAMP domain-containing protein 2-like [Tetranychus urticae]